MGRTGLIWRGQVYHVDLGQPIGTSQPFAARQWSCRSIFSTTDQGGLVAVVPVTTVGYGLRSHVELKPASSGLGHTSYARCDQLRVVSVERLSSRQGMISPEQMHAIDQALRFVLDL